MGFVSSDLLRRNYNIPRTKQPMSVNGVNLNFNGKS